VGYPSHLFACYNRRMKARIERKIDHKGRVSVPKEAMFALGVSEGDTIAFALKGKRITMERRDEDGKR
jgi:AbrB family looped-hinge helix DNA binding protein